MKTVENCSYKQWALHVRVALVSVLIKLVCDKDLSAESIAMLCADSLTVPMSNMVSTTKEDITYIDLPLATYARYASWSSLCKNGCKNIKERKGKLSGFLGKFKIFRVPRASTTATRGRGSARVHVESAPSAFPRNYCT
jgi:hypothetical protein